MKKVAIISLYGNTNFGNKLQNYAVQEIVKKHGFYPENIRNFNMLNSKQNKYLNYLKFQLEYLYNLIFKNTNIKQGVKVTDTKRRKESFLKFNKHINNSKSIFSFLNLKKFQDYDYYIVGSDQVWNPNYGGLSDLYLLNFTNKKKIALSASIGVENLTQEQQIKMKDNVMNFDKISLREDKGKEIIKEITNRSDIEVLVDPTMMLSTKEWDAVSVKPIELKDDNYVLCYFLGELDPKLYDSIKKFAIKKKYRIINILDKNDKYNYAGPSEFLYLESHAKAIFTDSFHSALFSILYHVPFVVSERKSKSNNIMNSRINTLLKKFELENQLVTNGEFENKLNLDFSNVDKILEKERKKFSDFIVKSFNENK